MSFLYPQQSTLLNCRIPFFRNVIPESTQNWPTLLLYEAPTEYCSRSLPQWTGASEQKGSSRSSGDHLQ